MNEYTRNVRSYSYLLAIIKFLLSRETLGIWTTSNNEKCHHFLLAAKRIVNTIGLFTSPKGKFSK